MRYRLRTLLILLAVLPPLLWIGWTKYAAWKAEQERQKALREAKQRIWQVMDYDSGPIMLTKIEAYPMRPPPVRVPEEAAKMP